MTGAVPEDLSVGNVGSVEYVLRLEHGAEDNDGQHPAVHVALVAAELPDLMQNLV